MEGAGYSPQDQAAMNMYNAQAGSGPGPGQSMGYGMGQQMHGGCQQDGHPMGGQGPVPGHPGGSPGGPGPQQGPAGYPMQGHPMQGGVHMAPDGSQMMGMHQYGMIDHGGQQGGQHPGQMMYPGGCGCGGCPCGGGGGGCGGCPQGCGGQGCAYMMQPMGGMMIPGGMMPQGVQAMGGGQPGQHPGMHPNMQMVMIPGNPGQMQQGMQPGMQGMQPGMQGGPMPNQMQQMPGQGMQMGMPPQQMPGQMGDGQPPMNAAQTGPGGCGGQILDQGKGGCQGVLPEGGADAKGGGARVAALSRNIQPKQGANWQGGGRGSGRPPAELMSAGRNFEQPNFGDQTQGDQGKGPGGQAVPPSPQQDGAKKGGNNKLRHPKNPWADIQDSQGGFDQEMQQMWSIRQPGQQTPTMEKQGQKGGMLPQAGGYSHPPSPANKGRGKGHKDGKDGGKAMVEDAGGKGGKEAGAQKWVAVDQAKGGKGQHRQDQWQPKEQPKMQAPTAAVPAKGGKGAAAPALAGSCGSQAPAAPSGGKQKAANNKPPPAAAGPPARRDPKMDDWLSARFGGQPPPTPTGSTITPSFGDDDWGDGKAYGEEGEEDGDGRRGKRKGGAGGKGGGGAGGGGGKGKGQAKGDDKRPKGGGASKGKDKGKGKGQFWG